MNTYLVPLTSACTLITLNYVAIKIRSKMLIDSHEQALAPLLTGLASIVMMLVPFPASLGFLDLRSLPIFMAGIRYGFASALLSTLLPAIATLLFTDGNPWLLIGQELLIPAVLAAFFHNQEYRSGFMDIPIKHAFQLSISGLVLRCVSQLALGSALTLPLLVDQLLITGIIFATFAIILIMINDENRSWRLQRELELQANQDGLTKLPNLRSFLPIAANLLRKRNIAILMIDLDNFKQYNDFYGHLAGDQLLREISSLLRHHIDEQDYLARYGGEEFILLSTETNPVRLTGYANSLCDKVAETFAQNDQPRAIPITISIGMAISPNTSVELKKVISEADQALYASKHGGKNRATLFTIRPHQQKMNA